MGASPRSVEAIEPPKPNGFAPRARYLVLAATARNLTDAGKIFDCKRHVPREAFITQGVITTLCGTAPRQLLKPRRELAMTQL